MIAGLAWQVVSLATFMLLCADYARSVKKAGSARFLKSRESMGKLGVSAGRMQYFMGGKATLTPLTIDTDTGNAAYRTY